MKPEPVKYTSDEGGEWHEWRYQYVPQTSFHAVMFEDGSVFDAINGWRKQRYCPCCGAHKPE
jgi:hypothetical protein